MMDPSSLMQDLHDAAIKARADENSALKEKVAGIVRALDKRIEEAPANSPEPETKTASDDTVNNTRADDLLMAGILVFAEADAIRRSIGQQQA